MSQETIDPSWVKAKLLPFVVEADLNNECGKTRCKTIIKAAAEVLLLFEDLPVSEKEKALKASDMTVDPTLNQAITWLDVERDEEVQTALVSDSVAEEEESSFAEATLQMKAETDVGDDGPTVRPCAPILPARQLSVMFPGLEELAFDTNLPESGMLLRQAKRSLYRCSKASCDR